jgi:hypothetical protein
MVIRSLIIIVLLLTIKNVSALECIYAPKSTKQDPSSELSLQSDCGKIVDGDVLKLKNSDFKRLNFSEEGLAWILIPNPRPIKVFYVSKKGRVVRTHFYDNGADYFEEGLSRMISNNKFGYMDKDLNTVITPKYDFAFPFRNGHAIVCNHCKPENTDEHREVAGGNWGVINRDGKVVISIIFTRDELGKTEEFKKIFNRPTSLNQ